MKMVGDLGVFQMAIEAAFRFAKTVGRNHVP